jgi:hypothetical protein
MCESEYVRTMCHSQLFWEHAQCCCWKRLVTSSNLNGISVQPLDWFLLNFIFGTVTRICPHILTLVQIWQKLLTHCVRIYVHSQCLPMNGVYIWDRLCSLGSTKWGWRELMIVTYLTVYETSTWNRISHSQWDTYSMHDILRFKMFVCFWHNSPPSRPWPPHSQGF